MILILSAMLLATLFAGIQNSNSNIPVHDTSGDTNQDEPVEVKPVVSSYKGNIDNTFNVPEEVMNTIISYMDGYYSSIGKLELVDMSDLFCNDLIKTVSDNAINLLINTRKLYDFDFGFDKGRYDLKVVDYRSENGSFYVDILEDDTMSFNFLNGIESRTFDVENYFEIKNVDGVYKINNLEKIQGYYMGFYEDTKTADQASSIYNYYYSQLKDIINYNIEVLKPRAQSEVYSNSVTVTGKYDRTAAIEYANLYYHNRNDQWYNFTDEGGNCQNYASQSMLSGGIPMDFLGEYQWKCFIEDPEFDPEINETEVKEGRSASWVHVGSFYEYALNNTGFGLAADVDVNLYYAEPGDIILVGNGQPSHTVIVSKVVDGHVLVNSNSIDMKDYPIEAYTYTTVILVKVLGYN